MTVLDKVRDAIETLAEPGGASRPAIAKAVKAQHGEVSAPLLKKALAQGVAKGLLVQQGQRFALAGVEIAARPEDTVESEVLRAGAGATCEPGDSVTMSYVGTLKTDGSCFDKAKQFQFTLGGGVTRTPPTAVHARSLRSPAAPRVRPSTPACVPALSRAAAAPRVPTVARAGCGAQEVIKGWDVGILGMQVGEKRRLTIPPKLGYGKRGSGKDIPPDSTLMFEVEMKKFS